MPEQNFSGNSNYELQATISRSGQTISVTTIRVRRKAGTGYWTNTPGYPWSVEIGPSSWSGSWIYDFTGGTVYQTVTSNRSASRPLGSSNTVRVQVSMGSGIGSATITQSVSIPDTPNTVGAPTLSDATTTQYVLSWPLPGNGGSAITGYEIQINTTASPTGAQTLSQGLPRTRTITGRTPGQIQWARVRAENAMGFGGWSSWQSIVTLPVAPASLTLVAGSPNTTALNLSYTRGSNGGNILEYQIEYNTDPNSSGSTVVSNGTSLSRALTGLIPASVNYARVRARTASGWGAWSGWVNRATFPVAPASVAVGSPTISSVVVSYARGTNGKSVLEYQIQHNSSASESGATTVSNGTGLSRTITGLPAGSTRFARVRARSAAGWGAWSGWASGATLPAGPPGIAVAPTPSGAQATVSLSPPSGVTTVTRYLVQYRRGATGAVTQFETTSTSATRSGLQPGVAYQWRASAFIGTYQSPWSNWVSVLQPNPTWLPGDFLAGSLAAGLDVTYAWTGTANGSTSTATGVGVLGWANNNANGALHRITGGLFGAYSARQIARRDLDGATLNMWMRQTIEVDEGGQYVASVWVMPSRDQEMRIDFEWRSESVTIAVSEGAPIFCVGDEWTRVTSALEQAPPTADGAYIVVKEAPAGAAFSPWLGGEHYDADGMMVTLGALYPYFDGSFPDTAEFDYAWSGTAHQSTSSRTTLAQSDVDPLQDPDCPPIPLAPMPPAISAECIDEVGVWRRYWSIVPADEIAQWISTVPTFTLVSTEAVGQVRIRVYENPDEVEPDAINTSDYISEQLVTFIPADTTLVIDGVSELTRASVAGGDWLAADHLLQGSGGGPATWPVLSCGIGYIISYDVPLDQPDGNMTPSVALTRRQ